MRSPSYLSSPLQALLCTPYLISYSHTHLQFNNTLAPYKTCPNASDRRKSDRGTQYVEEWAGIYLKDARARLAAQFHGYDLTIEDTYVLQQMCAYEVGVVLFLNSTTHFLCQRSFSRLRIAHTRALLADKKLMPP